MIYRPMMGRPMMGQRPIYQTKFGQPNQHLQAIGSGQFGMPQGNTPGQPQGPMRVGTDPLSRQRAQQYLAQGWTLGDDGMLYPPGQQPVQRQMTPYAPIYGM